MESTEQNIERNWRSLIVPGVTVLVIIAALAGYFIFGGNADKENAAAIVNGEIITKEELAAKITEIEKVQNTKPEASLVLEQMINEALLMEDARKKNITADEATIEQEYQKTMESFGGEEQLNTRLAEVGLSTEKLKRNIKNQLIISQYVQTQIDPEKTAVNDDEAKNAYDSAKETNKDLPPFNEVLEEIKFQLKQGKINTQLAEIINALRGSANIELLEKENQTQ
jgi:hypothetical protein